MAFLVHNAVYQRETLEVCVGEVQLEVQARSDVNQNGRHMLEFRRAAHIAAQSVSDLVPRS